MTWTRAILVFAMRAPVLMAIVVACVDCDAVFGLQNRSPNLLADASPDASADAAPNAGANIVFVTSGTVTPMALTGSDADAFCAQAAQSANLPGTYAAYLDAGSGADARLGNARGWVRTDGLPFADRVSDLDNGKIIYPPRKDETGSDIGEDAKVVTGALVECGSTGTQNLFIGDAWYTTGGWNAINVGGCTTPFHLYCFETDHDVAVVAVGSGSGRFAFVTVDAFSPGSAGIAAADDLCGSEAAVAGLPGTYLAVLAQTTATAMSRFDLAGPTWVRLDGVPIATRAIDFEAQAWQAPLNVTSAGTYVNASVYVGVDSLTMPGPVDTTCNDWMDSSGFTGWVGLAGASSADAVNFNPSGLCSGNALYCLQQ